MTNWDVNSCKFALRTYYTGADNQTGNDQQACQWIAEHSDQFYDIIDGVKDKNGQLSGQELQILFQANAELMHDETLVGLAKPMHPVIEQMGLSTMKEGPVDRAKFKAILNQTFLQFATSWGVEVPPAGNFVPDAPPVQVEFQQGGMQPGVQIAPDIKFGSNLANIPQQTVWNVNDGRGALENFYMGADMQTGNDQAACEWIAANADQFFDIIDRERNGQLCGQELTIIYNGNAEMLNNPSRQGIAKLMHPVIEQMGFSTMQFGPLDRNRFKAILNETFMRFAPAWGVQMPPNGFFNAPNIPPYQMHPGGMQPGIQINANIPFGMNMTGSINFGPGGYIFFG